ncbi:hypothetical protein JB92DRAFT_930091 [Gautieria morchelliformis]|nr:hypothetical protein JB92DRAFT_930091 [Gautieria morchelliformis]
MMAWGPGDATTDPLANVPDFSADRRLSPLAQSTLSAMSSYDSPYGPALYPGAGSPGSIPKKRVDALAEAWGMAEPEPFEEFFAAGGDKSATSSIMNGKDGHNSTSSRRAKDARDAYRDQLEDASRPSRSPLPRSALPPPKPISLPGSQPTEAASAPTLSSSPDDSTHFPPRRSRSLISRIRKMRDAPNVPVTYDEETEPSEATAESAPDSLESAPTRRANHKHQTSFLGRFTRSPGPSAGAAPAISPASDYSPDFDDDSRDKDLPPPPGDYFADPSTSPTRALGRKTSLMKRIKGVRRGTKP